MESFCHMQGETTKYGCTEWSHQLTFSIPIQNYCQFRIRKEELQGKGQVLFIALVQNRKEVASLP